MVTKKMIHNLVKKKVFRLEFIGDLSCDIDGSIELTHKTTTPDMAIPAEIRRAVIAEGGKLTKDSSYLKNVLGVR